MRSTWTKNLMEKLGASVDDIGVQVEILDRIDEAKKFGHALDPVKAAHDPPGRSQEDQTPTRKEQHLALGLSRAEHADRLRDI